VRLAEQPLVEIARRAIDPERKRLENAIDESLRPTEKCQ